MQGSLGDRGPARDFVGYGPNPPQVTWPGGASLAVNLVINFEEGSEYSHWAGDGRNESIGELPSPRMAHEFRDLSLESVYEYGSRAGIWRLLRLFDEFDVKGTLFAAAIAIERNPSVGAWIRQAGHDVCAHGLRWVEPWLLTRNEEASHISAAVDLITQVCGGPPQGWYSRYSASIHTRKLLAEFGEPLLYDSDAYNDDLPYYVRVGEVDHLVVPYNSFAYNDARYSSGMTPQDYFDMCRRGLDEYRREGMAGAPKMMSIGLHARLSGQAGRVSAIRDLLDYARGRSDIWFARRADIATWWRENHPPAVVCRGQES